jgi:hypothetical protein
MDPQHPDTIEQSITLRDRTLWVKVCETAQPPSGLSPRRDLANRAFGD